MKSCLLLLLLASFVAAPLAAQGKCSANLLPRIHEGNWTVVCDGYLTPGPNAPLLPAKELALCNATPEGVYTCEGTLSLGGTVSDHSVVGQATVKEDCTGTITYKQKINGNPVPQDLNVRFIILEHGKKIKGLAVDAGSTLSCTLYRM